MGAGSCCPRVGSAIGFGSARDLWHMCLGFCCSVGSAPGFGTASNLWHLWKDLCEPEPVEPVAGV
eukprot:460784-Pelagomonas_calceolata.AAC.5